MEIFKEEILDKRILFILYSIISIIVMCLQLLFGKDYLYATYYTNIGQINMLFILIICSFYTDLYDVQKYHNVENSKLFLIKYFSGIVCLIPPYIISCIYAKFILNIDTYEFIVSLRMVVLLIFFYTYVFFCSFSSMHKFKKFILSIIGVATPIMLYVITILLMNDNLNDVYSIENFLNLIQSYFDADENNYISVLILILSTLVMFLIQFKMYMRDYKNTKFAIVVTIFKNLYLYFFLLSISGILFYNHYDNIYTNNYMKKYNIMVAILTILVLALYFMFKYLLFKDCFKKINAVFSIIVICGATVLYFNTICLDVFGISTYAPNTKRIVSAKIYKDTFFEKENIERIKAIQKMQPSNMLKYNNFDKDKIVVGPFTKLEIQYKTKYNEVRREYFAQYDEKMYEAFKDLYSDDEYKNNYINQLNAIKPNVTALLIVSTDDKSLIELQNSKFLDAYIEDVKNDEDFSKYAHSTLEIAQLALASGDKLLKEYSNLYIKGDYKNSMDLLKSEDDFFKNKKIVLYKNPGDALETKSAVVSGKKYFDYNTDMIIKDATYDEFISKINSGYYEDVSIIDYNTEPEKYISFIEKTKFDLCSEGNIIPINKDTVINRVVFVNEEKKYFTGIAYRN